MDNPANCSIKKLIAFATRDLQSIQRTDCWWLTVFNRFWNVCRFPHVLFSSNKACT